MGVAEFIENKFIGKILCIFLGEHAETITYDQAWAANKEFFKGIVLDVTEGVLTLDVQNIGAIYINCEQIQSFWEEPFDYHRAVHTSITRRLVGARRKDI